MIKSFRHKGLEEFFKQASKARIQPAYAKRLRVQLAKLNASKGHEDMALPGWKPHRLSGGSKDHWSVWVNGNWRVTFTFDNGDAILVDYQDYH